MRQTPAPLAVDGTLPARTVRRRSSVSNRGVTFVEVICAIVILSVTATVIISAVNAIVSGQQRSFKRLGAAEIANRLMLQYLDDEESLPSDSLPIDYGRDRYRWTMSTSPITLVPAKEPPASRATRQPTGLGAERLKSVTFRVTLADPSGSPQSDPGAPGFVLTRIVDPIFGPIRNPDSRQRLLEDPVAYRKFLEQFVGSASGAPPAAAPDRSGSRRPNTPAPERPAK